jgi:hypothetical protein
MIRTIEGRPGIFGPRTSHYKAQHWGQDLLRLRLRIHPLGGEIFILSRGAKIKGCNVAEIETVRLDNYGLFSRRISDARGHSGRPQLWETEKRLWLGKMRILHVRWVIHTMTHGPCYPNHSGRRPKYVMRKSPS